MMFSVIIPVFNRQELVKNAIQSVMNQDYIDWECIVVDDASTDNTFSILQDYSEKDSRIKVTQLAKNSGVSAARNGGLEISSGEYILFLDSDDELAFNAMSTLSAILKENDVDIVVFATSQEWIPAEGMCNRVLDRDFIRNNIFPQHINIHPQTEYFLLPYVWNKCIKRTLIIDNSIRFDEWRRIWEDNVFLVECLNRCNNMFVLPDKIHMVGNNKDIERLSRVINESLFMNYIDSYKKYRDHYGAEYNFDNDYTARRYFGVIHEHLILYYERCSSTEFKHLVSMLICDDALNSWVERIQSKNQIEEDIKEAFRNSDVNALFDIYAKISKENMHLETQIHIAKQAVSRLKRRIRKHLR